MGRGRVTGSAGWGARVAGCSVGSVRGRIVLRGVLVGRCQIADQGCDRDDQGQGHRARAPAQARPGGRDAHPVGEGRTERPGQDVRPPERGHRVEAEIAAGQGGHGDQGGEEEARREVPELQRARREVADRGAQGEGGEHGGPVEDLAAAGADAVDRQRPLTDVPGGQNGGERQGEGRRGDRVGDAGHDVDDVGGHRAEHADHDDRRPVRPGPVSVAPELCHQCDHQTREPEGSGGNGPQCAPQVVRGGLAHAGRQHLDDPEDGRDGGDLAQAGAGRGCRPVGVFLRYGPRRRLAARLPHGRSCPPGAAAPSPNCP